MDNEDEAMYAIYAEALEGMEKTVRDTIKDELYAGIEDVIMVDGDTHMYQLVQEKINDFLAEQEETLTVAVEKFVEGLKATVVPNMIEYFNREAPEERGDGSVPDHLKGYIEDPAFEHFNRGGEI